MKLRHRLLSILLCLVLVLGVFPAVTTPTADAGIGALFAGFAFQQLMGRTMLALATGINAIGEAAGDPETAALVNKWALGITDPSLEVLAKLAEQMAKFHAEVMNELNLINDKLDKNLSGIESALGSAAVNDAYDDYLSAWNSDVTVPMALHGYNQVVNSYKIYLEYAGSYKTGSKINYGGTEMVATEDMVRSCYVSFRSALITMTGQAYDATSGMTQQEYYDHILYETNNIDLKVQSTINNLLGRMLNATGAPSGGRYLDRAAQVAFAYFPFSEDQAAFVDAASKKQVYEITMALMAYQEFIGMRLMYCEEKYNALKESGASEEELSALQTKIDNYCTPNKNIEQLIAGGAACTYPGGVMTSVSTWLSAPLYISLSDNSYLYLQDYLRATSTDTFTLINTTFRKDCDLSMLLEEGDAGMTAANLNSSSWSVEGIERILGGAPSAEHTAEQMEFVRRGVIVPSANGKALVKPIYILSDQTDDRSGMLMSELSYNISSNLAGLLSGFLIPSADYYNLRDGIYSDGHNTYTAVNGTALQALVDNNALSLSGGTLQGYFCSVIGTYPTGRTLSVFTPAPTKNNPESCSAFGLRYFENNSTIFKGIDMLSTASFLEEDVSPGELSTRSYVVVLAGGDATYVDVDVLSTVPGEVTLTGEDYDPATGLAKAGSKLTLTVSNNKVGDITARFRGDASSTQTVTGTEVIVDAANIPNMTNADGTVTVHYYVPYTNVTLRLDRCPHDVITSTTYTPSGTGSYHFVRTVCTACDYETSNTTEDCRDLDLDCLCDKCKVCMHTVQETTVVSNGNSSHTVTTTCTGCGRSTHTTQPCIDEDSDSICDICHSHNIRCTHKYDENGFCDMCGFFEPAVLSSDYYEISNVGQLYWFSSIIRSDHSKLDQDSIPTFDSAAQSVVYLWGRITAPLDLSVTQNEWIPIGTSGTKFQGRFDGGGHHITGLDGALFGSVSGATVSNIAIESGIFGVSDNGLYAGSIACEMLDGSKLEHSYSKATGEAEATLFAGGLVGRLQGTMKNCYFAGDASQVKAARFGGLAGSGSGTFINCHVAAPLSTGSSRSGALLGDHSNDQVLTNVWYDSSLTSLSAGTSLTAPDWGAEAARSHEDFTSGELTYAFNGDQSDIVWYQTIGKQDYPEFTGLQVFFEEPDAYYNDCDHESTTTDFTDNGDGTHTVTETCDSCCIGTVSETVENCVDNDSDELCDLCGADLEQEDDGLFSLAGCNMTLGNELVVNFMMAPENYAEGQYAVLTHNGEEHELPLYTLIGYYAASYGIAAKQMADPLTVTIFDADGNAVSEPFTSSVRDYVSRGLSNDIAEDVGIMLVDMLNYGAAAQSFFRYNTEDLANNTLTEEQAAMASPTPSSEDKSHKGEHCYGSNLTLGDRILLNMFFENLPEATEGMYAEISFTDHYGRKASITVDNAEFVKENTTYTRIVIDDIVLADARQMVTMTVYNADGSAFGSCTDSVESYIARANAADEAELYDTILRFADSAHTYLHNR